MGSFPSDNGLKEPDQFFNSNQKTSNLWGPVINQRIVTVILGVSAPTDRTDFNGKVIDNIFIDSASSTTPASLPLIQCRICLGDRQLACL